MQKKGIALLVTLFFITAIMAIVGVSMHYYNKASSNVAESHLIVQGDAIMSDVITFLQNSEDVKSVSDAESLQLFLSTSSLIPIQKDSLSLVVMIQSASDRFNINDLKNFNEDLNIEFEEYLVKQGVSDPLFFMDLLRDSMSGVKENYLSELFVDKPTLYKERLTSQEHLDEILDFYVMRRYENSVKTIPWSEAVTFNETNSTFIDPNYMPIEVWKMLIPRLSTIETQMIVDNEELFKDDQELLDIGLSEQEVAKLHKFNLTYFSPIVRVILKVSKGERTLNIEFQYNLQTSQVYKKTVKGSIFEFNI
ncbi:MAG: hypothetical protein GQ570_10030 [Helicobacteraceae bacterium]|nr:hypothetical protein [Helicobacteraceae bacterium]